MHKLGQDKNGQRQTLRAVDQNQRRQRIDQIQIHDQLQNTDAAEPDRHHDADSQIQAQQRVTAKTITGQRPGRHRTGQQDNNQGHDGNGQAVAEIQLEIGPGQHFAEPAQTERCSIRQTHRVAENRFAGFKRIDNDQKDRPERNQGIAQQDDMNQRGAGNLPGLPNSSHNRSPAD